MNNQQWQPPQQPTYGQQAYGQPPWPPQQSIGQGPNGQMQWSRLPMPGYAQPQSMQFDESSQQNYMPQPQQFQPVPPPPEKKGFFSKKVAVPLWAIILMLIVLVGLTVNLGSKSSSADTSQKTSTSTATNQGGPRSTVTTPSGAQTQPTAVPTQAPTHTPKWTTVLTFTGNGSKKTAVFHVGDDWKIVWSCNPSSFYGGEYNLALDVNNPDTTSLDPGAVNTICKAGNTSDTTEEHQGGDVYLDINSEGAWKIQVAELR